MAKIERAITGIIQAVEDGLYQPTIEEEAFEGRKDDVLAGGLEGFTHERGSGRLGL